MRGFGRVKGPAPKRGEGPPAQAPVEKLEPRLLFNAPEPTYQYDSLEPPVASGLSDSAAVAAPSAPAAPSQLTAYDVRFAVIGDFGNNSTGERDVANLVKSWGVDFVVTVGDNSYPDSTAPYLDRNVGQYYHEFIHPYRGTYGAGSPTGANRFFPIMGNHDWDNGSLSNYLSYFTLPGNERYYELRAGPVHLFAVSSDSREPDGISSTSVQAQWLRNRMSASAAPWQVPLVHHPPYSSAGGTSTTMRWPYKTWGADAVLSGHAHVYERIETGGLTYMINGLGGAARSSFGTPVSGSQVRYAADVGAMLVQANAQSITFQFINRSGNIIDTKTLNAPAPPPVSTVLVPVSGSGGQTPWQPAGPTTLPREGRTGPSMGEEVRRRRRDPVAEAVNSPPASAGAPARPVGRTTAPAPRRAAAPADVRRHGDDVSRAKRRAALPGSHTLRPRLNLLFTVERPTAPHPV